MITMLDFVIHCFVLLSLTLAAPMASDASLVGVCYGLLGDDLPPPEEAVQLLNGLGITRVRFYSPSHDHHNALRNTGIEVSVGVPSDQVQKCASDPVYASIWVYLNVLPYSPDVKFRYIVVGNNEDFGTPDAAYIGPAIQNIHNALVSTGYGTQIKVSTAVHMAVMDSNNYFLPSAGSFSDAAIPFMQPTLEILNKMQSPLLLNLFPYFAYIDDPKKLPLAYALFDQQTDLFVDEGSNLTYRNLFDAMLDSFYTAMENIGFPCTEVVISESGWPSGGGYPVIATLANAEAYNNNLVKYAMCGGSPKRPYTSLETYVFAIFKEDQKTGEATENNFGLFYPNKQPVYSFSLPPA